ncbi:MAG: PIN domain-containing protein [Opitutales bacterium]|nr:PIN domain-containing protein [Opitutales bacterium]NRA27032.1 PIN domain-containing protein [Opitutales bacterium]
MTFVDTNVLLYAICPGESDREKARIAQEILRRDNLVLSIQVLQEFYVQATRISRTDAITHEEATALIKLWLRFQVVQQSVAILQHALDLKARYQISYWDAAILAAAVYAGCTTVLSEDLNAGQRFDSAQVLNPFDDHHGA